MATIEERVAFLEGRSVEFSRQVDGIREAVMTLGQRIVHLEQRIDQRFAAIDQRCAGIDQRIDNLDAKVSRQFTWLVGMQVTTLAAIVAALVAR